MQSSSPQSAAGKERQLKPLSCSNCRQRKVKCSKVHPCPQCVRGGLECVFPTRKRNRRPRQNRQHELLDRLAKLEEIVGKVDPASLSALKPAASTSAASTATSTSQQPQAAQEDFSQGQGSREQAEDRSASLSPSKDDPAAKYLSGEFWSNLCGEVEGLKQALAQTSSDTDDEEDAGTESTPDSQGQSVNSPGQATGAAVFGNANAFGSVSLTHPETEQILQLSAVYWYNVDPLFKILHRPTMESGLERFARSPDLFPVDRATEALYFSMYFAAVTSLSPASCKSKLGEERSTLVQRFRLAVEVALAKADYLNSTQLELFQALALYVVSHTNSLPEKHPDVNNVVLPT